MFGEKKYCQEGRQRFGDFLKTFKIFKICKKITKPESLGDAVALIPTDPLSPKNCVKQHLVLTA